MYLESLRNDVDTLMREPGSAALGGAFPHVARALADVLNVEKGPSDVNAELLAPQSAVQNAGVRCTTSAHPPPEG